jgi:hypothetical protein
MAGYPAADLVASERLPGGVTCGAETAERRAPVDSRSVRSALVFPVVPWCLLQSDSRILKLRLRDGDDRARLKVA